MVETGQSLTVDPGQPQAASVDAAVSSLLDKIEALRIKKGRLLIAIDGRSASGKTTLAAYLKKTFGCNVITMDHFFLQPEQRTPERLSEPGGNVDYERFIEDVLTPILRCEGFSYKPFDCRRQSFGDTVSIQDNDMTIVEGAYSCHPRMFEHYDLRVFLSVGPEEQMRRILERNGVERAADFSSKWIPMEESYFSAFDIKERCDFCVIEERIL